MFCGNIASFQCGRSLVLLTWKCTLGSLRIMDTNLRTANKKQVRTVGVGQAKVIEKRIETEIKTDERFKVFQNSNKASYFAFSKL